MAGKSDPSKGLKNRKPRAARNAIHEKFMEMNKRIGRLAATGKPLSEADQELLQRTYQRQIDVMEGRVLPSQANFVLQACGRLQDDLLGPITQKMSVEAKMTLEQAVMGAIEISEGKAPKVVNGEVRKKQLPSSAEEYQPPGLPLPIPAKKDDA